MIPFVQVNQHNTTATGGISYLWNPSNSLNSPTTPFPTASPTNSTVYTVTATDNQNCQITDSVSIIVFDVPNFGCRK